MERNKIEAARRSLAALALALTAAVGVAAPASAQAPPVGHPDFAEQGCPSSHMPPLVLPTVQQALRTNSEILIVTLGSSSTQGWHATDIGHSYPAILQAELQAALPAAHVAVINRGVGGQDAVEMVPRLGADALAVRPSLVVWQLGANAAMRRGDPEVFRGLVSQGVATLQAGKADIVLMDNQRAPNILGTPDEAAFDQALSDVAARTGTGLFSRGALMDQWQAAGHPYGEFISTDGVHHNDRGYRCMAKALAGAILNGLGMLPQTIQSASRH